MDSAGLIQHRAALQPHGSHTLHTALQASTALLFPTATPSPVCRTSLRFPSSQRIPTAAVPSSPETSLSSRSLPSGPGREFGESVSFDLKCGPPFLSSFPCQSVAALSPSMHLGSFLFSPSTCGLCFNCLSLPPHTFYHKITIFLPSFCSVLLHPGF